jgi:hypothetical protein
MIKVIEIKMLKLCCVLIYLFFIVNICKGQDAMKLFNAQSEIERIVSWIYDYKQEYSHFPESLEDLVENKPTRCDYDSKKALKRYYDFGYEFVYSLLSTDQMEVSLKFNNILYYYKSNDSKFYFYQDGILIREYQVR